MMRRINKEGRYSQHFAAKKLASTRQGSGPERTRPQLLNTGSSTAEVLASSPLHPINVPSSRAEERAGYKMDAAIKPTASGGSIHDPFQQRLIVPSGKAGEDSKMFDSSPHLTVFEGGPSHRTHTYNTRRSVIQSQDNLADSLQRLGEFRLVVDQSRCPKYKRIKEHTLSTRQ